MTAAPRRWLEVSVTAPAGEDEAGLVVDGLISMGCRGAVERDGRIVGYLPEPVDADAVERGLRARLDPGVRPGHLEVSVRWLPHEDWAEAWKAGLAPRRVGSRIVVSPSWERPALGGGDLLVVIDPGMAFGTAEHGTTRGCLRLMELAVRDGDHLLDVGAGSGILSVAAARLGAGRVTAVEMDRFSFGTLVENVGANGVAEVVSCLQERVDPSRLGALGPADGVVANIDAAVLRSLLPAFGDVLRRGGWVVLSGVLAEEWPELSADMEAHGFRARAVDDDGEWRSGLFDR